MLSGKEVSLQQYLETFDLCIVKGLDFLRKIDLIEGLQKNLLVLYVDFCAARHALISSKVDSYMRDLFLEFEKFSLVTDLESLKQELSSFKYCDYNVFLRNAARDLSKLQIP